MQYKVEYDQENDCLIGCFQGVFSSTSFYSDYVEELRRKAQEHDCLRFLHDFRNVRIEMSTTDLYTFSNEMRNERIDPKWKRALVVAQQYLNDSMFFETAAVNRGHRVRVFGELDEAVAWLKG